MNKTKDAVEKNIQDSVVAKSHIGADEKEKDETACLVFTVPPLCKTYLQVPDLRCKGNCLSLYCDVLPLPNVRVHMT